MSGVPPGPGAAGLRRPGREARRPRPHGGVRPRNCPPGAAAPRPPPRLSPRPSARRLRPAARRRAPAASPPRVSAHRPECPAGARASPLPQPPAPGPRRRPHPGRAGRAGRPRGSAPGMGRSAAGSAGPGTPARESGAPATTCGLGVGAARPSGLRGLLFVSPFGRPGLSRGAGAGSAERPAFGGSGAAGRVREAGEGWRRCSTLRLFSEEPRSAGSSPPALPGGSGPEGVCLLCVVRRRGFGQDGRTDGRRPGSLCCPTPDSRVQHVTSSCDLKCHLLGKMTHSVGFSAVIS